MEDLVALAIPKKKLLEKDIEKAVVAYARRKGILVYKFTSPSQRAVPDRMFLLKHGGMFFIEFKRSGGTPTAAQLREHAKLHGQGCTVVVCDDIDHGKNIIDIMSETF